MNEIPERLKELIDMIQETVCKNLEFNEHFWTVLAIRERFILNIYGYKEEFFNKLILISKKDNTANKSLGEFEKLNDKCFSAPNSIYMQLLRNKFPPISDILPPLNKSLIILKNPQKNWKEVTEFFDYKLVVKNLLSTSLRNIDFDSVKKDSKKIWNSFRATIENIYEDYEKTKKAFSTEKDRVLKSLKYIFTMYLYHLAMGYDIFIYYPLKITDNSEIILVSIFKYCNFTNSKEFLNFFWKYIKILSFCVHSQFYSTYLQEVMDHALRSAVAAIMARNMSHNIGSHVLVNVDDEKYDVGIKKVFNTYLQERMDFIAGVTSGWKGIPEEIWFFHDLLERFINNLLMIDNIVKSHGYDKSNISFIVNKKFVAKYNNEGKFKWFEYNNQTKEAKIEDFLVSIPKGITGTHAFYIILENIMRNSAKYGEKKDKMKIYIDYELKKDRYEIKVWENLSQSLDSLPKKINDKIRKDIINPTTGEPNYEDMGITEMKVCAELLSEPYNSDIYVKEEKGKKYYIWADERFANGLKYIFNLQIPKFLLIVDNKKKYSFSKDLGISQVNDINELKSQKVNFKLNVIKNDLPPDWEKRWYPYRMVKVAELSTQIDREMILDIYKQWIRKFFKITQNNIHMIISFSGEDRREIAERWKNCSFDFIKDLVQIHILLTTKENILNMTKSTCFNNKKKLEDFLEKNGKNAQFILYDNHIDMYPILKKYSLEKKIIYHHPTGDSVRALKLFNLLSNPVNDDFLIQYLILNLLETALTKILIIDERIAEYYANLIKKGEGNGRVKGIEEYKELSQKRNIFVPFYLKINNKKIFVSKEIEKIYKKLKEKNKTQIYGLEISERNSILILGENTKNIKFHIGVLHQGIIDECIHPNIKNDKWFEVFVKRCYHVVITSGRGKFIKYVPSDLPFVEFSILKNNLIDDFSGVDLLKALTTSKGGINGQ